MIILFQHVQSNLYYCDWMLKSRLWQPKYPCELNSTLNLDLWFNPGQNIASDSSTLDARIVTAISLSKTYDQSSITYKLLDLAPTGELSNAHIFMNTTVTVSEKIKGLTVYAVPFGSVQGSFDNVSVSGYVNLTISDFSFLNEVYLSRMFGFIPKKYDLTNYPAEYKDEFIFRNVSSSLKFFVNGVEIKENVTVNGVQFNISNGFGYSAVNVSNSDYQIQNDQNMHHFTYELTDSVTKETTDIKAWFAFPLNQGANDNSNALDDLYPLSFQMSLEKFYETKGMMLRRFNATGFELEYPYNNVDFVIYQENTKAVYMKDSQIIECNGNDVFDVKTRKCITRDACYSNDGQFLFQSTCVSQCPNNFVTFNQTCWVTCPQWLGAYLDAQSNQCAEITNNQYAIPHGQVQSCLGFVFKKGCYVVCPVGTITQGKTCSEPTSVSQCAINEYLILTGQVDLRYYSVCSPDAPSWMYRIVDQNNMVLNMYKSICSGVVQINNDCKESQSPNQIKASGLCSQECADGEYPQPLLQTCHQCLSNIYDGGLIFERDGYKCINSCSKWSLSGTKKICEDKFPNNCPFWQVISAGQFLCQTSCTSSQFQDGQVCSSCDPSLNKQVDKVNGGCLCKSGFFTKNMPDGSFTCTECDTTLNFKPSKEGSSCVCKKNYILQDNQCNWMCTSTQVILPDASACSTCAQNTVPNVAQDGCVGKTSCAPGFLNVAGTFCVSSCSVDSSIEGSSNQCVSCASKDPLSQFSSGQCVCVSGAARATSSSFCACNQNFTPASGSCSCSKKLSSDGQTCSEKCPIEEVSINNNAQCSTCASKVSNVDQTACVDKTGCSPGFLNMAHTHCVSDCAQDKATAGSNNQCVSCSSINDLSVFGSSSCICAPNAIGSGTSCACNTANGFSGAGCSCSKKLSADGSLCKDSCPTTELYLSGASACSTCAQNTVPNVAQDGCVGKTSCAPGFLNVAGTFCVSSCSVDSSIEGSSNQCVSCASKDPLSQFSSGQCVCVSGAARATSSSFCACNQNFTPASGSCSCSKKLSSDGQTCSEKCPASEVALGNGVQCSVCQSGEIPNEAQTECKQIITSCPSNQYIALNKYQCVSTCEKSLIDGNNCVAKCTNKLADVSNTLCVPQCSIYQEEKAGSCVCIQGYAVSGMQCVCDSDGGYSIIDGSCKCDESKGRKWKNNQCGCDDLLGYFQYPGQKQCACKKELGFQFDSGLQKCMCDYNRGFFALPVQNTRTGYFSCQCDSTRKYVNDTSAATLTCVKRNKSNAQVVGIVSVILIVLIIIIVLAILYKKKRSKEDDKLVNLNKSQSKSRTSDSSPKILNLKDPKQPRNIRKPSQLKIRPIRLSSPVPMPQSFQSLSTETSPDQDELIDNTKDALLTENAIDQSNQFKDEIPDYTSDRQFSQFSSHSSRNSPEFLNNKQNVLKPKKIKRTVIADIASLGTQNVSTETIKKNIKICQQKTSVKLTVVKGLQPMKKTIKPDKWLDII
ncbi:Conserved_hypothetical protein [Hexamita inflata]|uniref:Uncharacterized protein n=1 Tax=Hexamita inflata TaxID=28002 RepID=A0ABP1HAE7_9EUKA